MGKRARQWWNRNLRVLKGEPPPALGNDGLELPPHRHDRGLGVLYGRLDLVLVVEHVQQILTPVTGIHRPAKNFTFQ